MVSFGARAISIVSVLVLAACGGGGSSDSGMSATPPRGTLLEKPPGLVTVVSAVDLLAELNAPENLQLLALVTAPVCDVAFITSATRRSAARTKRRRPRRH